jgi:hypothetical protein
MARGRQEFLPLASKVFSEAGGRGGMVVSGG